MSFGERLAEERKRLGLRQAEFAALVGTDVPKQSLYETGRRELRADYLSRLADAKVDVGYVLTGQDLGPEEWPLERAPLMFETSIPGVFAAGDVRYGSVKRMASAVGAGRSPSSRCTSIWTPSRIEPARRAGPIGPRSGRFCEIGRINYRT